MGVKYRFLEKMTLVFYQNCNGLALKARLLCKRAACL